MAGGAGDHRCGEAGCGCRRRPHSWPVHPDRLGARRSAGCHLAWDWTSGPCADGGADPGRDRAQRFLQPRRCAVRRRAAGWERIGTRPRRLLGTDRRRTIPRCAEPVGTQSLSVVRRLRRTARRVGRTAGQRGQSAAPQDPLRAGFLRRAYRPRTQQAGNRPRRRRHQRHRRRTPDAAGRPLDHRTRPGMAHQAPLPADAVTQKYMSSIPASLPTCCEQTSVRWLATPRW